MECCWRGGWKGCEGKTRRVCAGRGLGLMVSSLSLVVRGSAWRWLPVFADESECFHRHASCPDHMMPTFDWSTRFMYNNAFIYHKGT